MTSVPSVGKRGEDLAAAFLRKQGFKLLERNRRTPYGEIDLICLDGRIVVFVEVKTRTGDEFGRPVDAVGPRKQRKISLAAAAWLAENRMENRRARFDVLAVDLGDSGPRIEHLRDAFDLAAG